MHSNSKKKLKKMISVSIVIALVFLSLFVVISFAHSGDTDSNGGHYDSSTGEYHYHHGEPAHQHNNGECPYETSDFSISFSKILLYIVGLLTFPLIVNMLIGGLISMLWDFISSKRKKTEPTPEEQLLIDEKVDKIYGFISIALFIIEIIVWTIIVFQW